VQSIIGGSNQAQARAAKPNPLSVSLDADEIARLDRVAADLDVSRHAIMQYAVRQFLAHWEKGERPGMTKREVNVLKVE